MTTDRVPVDELRAQRIRDLADDYADARIAREAADDEAKRLREVEDGYEAALFDALEASGISSFRTARGLFSQNDLAWAKVENAQAAVAWAEAHMPELISLQVQRLSKVVRDALKGETTIEDGILSDVGVALPPGVTYTTSRKIGWRRQ